MPCCISFQIYIITVTWLRILATVENQGSLRANLAALEEKRGSKLTITTKVVTDLVPANFTQ